MLKLLVPKFRPDLSARLKHIAEKQVPVKLKPIVIEPKEINGSFRESKEILESLMSDRYLKNLGMALENQQRTMLWEIK